MKKKNWVTLNDYGKGCLKNFLYALSASDIWQSKLDYINAMGLTDNKTEFKDSYQYRENTGMECLTDIGIETAAHYFPKYTNWEMVRVNAKSIFANPDYPTK